MKTTLLFFLFILISFNIKSQVPDLVVDVNKYSYSESYLTTWQNIIIKDADYWKRQDRIAQQDFDRNYKFVERAIEYYKKQDWESTIYYGKMIGMEYENYIVWHTQGSGKSLSMVFYSGKLITAPEMQNPTIVVITDRNDLDDQLFDTFAASVQLLRQEPVQAENREHLKELLKVSSGGIVFTTIQKFLPDNNKSVYDQLSDRKNIVVIADEAHRTQYGFEAKLIDEKDKDKNVIGKRIAFGFAKYMRDALPSATYIGFTGTPIEGTDVNTPQVFGQYVDVYDISQAVADGSTVRIYYESRLAKVNLDEEGRRLIEEFDRDLEQDEEITEKQKAKAKWTRI